MNRKRGIAAVLAVCLVLLPGGCAGKNETMVDVQKHTAEYLRETVPEPAVGSIGGEWSVLGLSRSGLEVPQEYYDTYYDNVRVLVKGADGVLSENHYTEYARVCIALAAIGRDPSDVEGYDLLAPLEDVETVEEQGLNGPVFALIAANACGYQLRAEQDYLSDILSRELEGGGFAFAENAREPEADMTGMALCALSFYREDAAVSAAIGRAVETLSELMDESSESGESSEIISQVILGLTSVGVDPLEDERFFCGEQTLYDRLSAYRAEDGFSHVAGAEANLMSTEEALCAIDALTLRADGKAFYGLE